MEGLDTGKLFVYIEYYNEQRLDWSLDIDYGETPLMAFGNKRATDVIRKNNLKWMEDDVIDGAT